MTREDFKKIIALRSIWTVGKGDYELPDGEYLHMYIDTKVNNQMYIDSFGINENGNLMPVEQQGEVFIFTYSDGHREMSYIKEQYDRIQILINEIINESQPVKGKELEII